MKKLMLVLVISLILSGCLPGVKSKGGPKAEGEFAKGQIVRGFPNVPLFPEAKVIESYGSKEKNFGASFVVAEDLVKVVNFYGPALTQTGWQNTLKKNSDSNYNYEINNDEFRGGVIINTASDGRRTAISVSVEPR